MTDGLYSIALRTFHPRPRRLDLLVTSMPKKRALLHLRPQALSAPDGGQAARIPNRSGQATRQSSAVQKISTACGKICGQNDKRQHGRCKIRHMPSVILRGTLRPCTENRLVSYTDAHSPPWAPRWLYATGEGDGIRLTLVQVASTVLFRGSWPLLALRQKIPFETRDPLLPLTLIKANLVSLRDVPVEIALLISDGGKPLLE